MSRLATTTIATTLMLALATLASAGGTPDQKCASSKLKAAAKNALDELKCHAKAVKKGVAVDTECIGKAEQKFSDSFTKAEDKGGCATVGDASDVEAIVESAVGAFVAALPDPGTDDGRKCASSKLGAAGKKVSGKLNCNAKAAGKGEAVDTTCLGKAEDKFMNSFTKAEAKGGCAT